MPNHETFPQMIKIVAPAKHGIATIDHYQVTKHDSMMSSFRGEWCPEGTYARLMVGSCLMMSDTLMEHRTNYNVVLESHGNVLIAGLGLGMILHPILKKDSVDSVTIIEKYEDVIALIEPTVRHKKLTIIHADIHKWKPEKGTKFDTIYFDIWSSQSTDDLEIMKKLHLRFRAFKAKGGWMESWRRKDLKARQRRGGW